MSVVDIPAFLPDLLQSVRAAVPLQHVGDAEGGCSSSDLENISTGGEGTAEEPAAAVTARKLAFRSHSSDRSQWLGPRVILGCFSWCLSKRSCLAMLGLKATLETSQPLMENVIEKLSALYTV